jgi:hypothetical protein
LSEGYRCEKCQKPLPIGKSYVWVHVEIADKPADDFRMHVECFRGSIKEDSSLFGKMTVVKLMKKIEEGSEHGA